MSKPEVSRKATLVAIELRTSLHAERDTAGFLAERLMWIHEDEGEAGIYETSCGPGWLVLVQHGCG